MIEFWLLASLLTLVVLALVVTPLLRKHARHTDTDATQLNTRLYHERLRDLDVEQANGNLDSGQYDAAREELARELLHDTEHVPAPAVTPSSGRWVAGVIAVAVPLLSIGLYQQLGASDLMARLDATVAAAQPPQHPAMPAGQDGLPPVQDMVSSLAAKLEQNPNNADGWQLLARSYMTLQRYQDAEAAYARAYAIKGDEPTLLADYAESMALANDNRLIGKPMALIQKALAIAPNHPKSLWMGGLASYQMGDFPTAHKNLSMLLTQLEAGSPDAQAVQSQIARIQQQMDGPLDAIIPPPVASRAQAQQAPTPTTANQDAADAGPRITVSVSLDEALANKAAPTDTVFIYARAPSGPRMPLAMARHTVADLPVTVTLTDAMAMMPAMNLSSFEEVMVMARVSKSGTAMTQSGDLVGSYGPVAITNQNPVSVTISEPVQ